MANIQYFFYLQLIIIYFLLFVKLNCKLLLYFLYIKNNDKNKFLSKTSLLLSNILFTFAKTIKVLFLRHNLDFNMQQNIISLIKLKRLW